MYMLFIRGLGRRIVEAEGIEFGKEAKGAMNVKGIVGLFSYLLLLAIVLDFESKWK